MCPNYGVKLFSRLNKSSWTLQEFLMAENYQFFLFMVKHNVSTYIGDIKYIGDLMLYTFMKKYYL